MTLDVLSRMHFAMLCALLTRAQNEPIRPWTTHEQLATEYIPFREFDAFAEVAKDLRDLGFISGIDIGSGSYNDQLLLTPRGAAFVISSAAEIAMQAHGLTDDYPDEWIEILFKNLEAIQSEAAKSEDSEDINTFVVPASDRYVHTSDNAVAFEYLAKTLSQIRDEFARDHNKGELISAEPAQNLLTEIDATLAQIRRGKVRVRQLSEGLKPQLTAALLFFSAYPGLTQFINDASQMLADILRGLGIR